MRKIIMGSRKGPLALAQTEIIQKLFAPHYPTSIETFTTEGDRNLDIHYKNNTQSLKGLFTRELEEQLLQKKIDVAVHSCKDLPSECPKGLVYAAYSKREDPRDIFISRSGKTLKELAAGSIVGTSSIRREIQLLKLRPDLHIKPIRGNVGTRIAKMNQGDYDGIVLAAAGLNRLHQENLITEYLSPEQMIPAPAQGVLVVQCRADDEELRDFCRRFIHDNHDNDIVMLERAFAARYGVGCSSPLACYAHKDQQTIVVKAMLEKAGQIVFLDEKFQQESCIGILDKLYELVEGL
ncbi:MAG: hydroxymethylbilane synthase [Brevinema sp.]